VAEIVEKFSFSEYAINDSLSRLRWIPGDGIHLEPNDAEQAVIEIARKLRAGGMSSRAIAAQLAAQGLYSRQGTVFTPSAIISMVAS
jgi:hypothetical protein